MRPVHQCALRFASCLDSETHVVNMLLHVVRHVCRGAAMFSDPPKCPVPPSICQLRAFRDTCSPPVFFVACRHLCVHAIGNVLRSPNAQGLLRWASCLDSETHADDRLLHVVRHVCVRGIGNVCTSKWTRGTWGSENIADPMDTKKSASAHATHKSSACISEYKQLATRGSWGSESCLHIENTHRPSLASRSRSVIEAAPPDETNARARQVRGFGTEPHARRTAYFQRWKEPAHTLITAGFFHRFRTHIRRLSFQSIVFGTIRGGGGGLGRGGRCRGHF